MAKSANTPEEELLNLIQKEKGFSKPKKKRRKARLFNFSQFKKIKKLPFYLYGLGKKGWGEIKNKAGEGSLKPAITILTAGAIILASYLTIDFIFGRPDIKKIEQRPLPQRKEYSFSGPQVFQRTALSYLAMVQRRNVFSPFMIEPAEEEPVDREIEELEQKAEELAANLRIAGILLKPRPQVMIENQETNETFFLNKGDIVNNLTVEEIKADRAILNYKGKVIELF